MGGDFFFGEENEDKDALKRLRGEEAMGAGGEEPWTKERDTTKADNKQITTPSGAGAFRSGTLGARLRKEVCRLRTGSSDAEGHDLSIAHAPIRALAHSAHATHVGLWGSVQRGYGPGWWEKGRGGCESNSGPGAVVLAEPGARSSIRSPEFPNGARSSERSSGGWSKGGGGKARGSSPPSPFWGPVARIWWGGVFSSASACFLLSAAVPERLALSWLCLVPQPVKLTEE